MGIGVETINFDSIIGISLRYVVEGKNAVKINGHI